MIFPIITFPYVSRILGVENLGKYNFSNSVVSYFLLIAGLGINTYAIREGAKYRDERKINIFASEIFSINILSTLISYLLLFLCLALIPKLQPYIYCILIFSLQIFFTTLGTEWIYSIYEDYTYITIRSIIFKIISVVLLFIFVRKQDDYLFYAAITVFSAVGSNILNYLHARSFVKINFRFHMNIGKHIKPILIIFASNIAVLIYVNSDVTILGFLKNVYVVGIYSVSAKIYTILKTMLSAALIVTVPRLALLYGKKKWKEYRNTASQVFNFLVLITFPAVIGLIMVSRDIVLILSGQQYISATSSLRLLCIAAIFSIFAWFYSDCILIPAKKEKIVLISTILSAVVNILLNFMLVPFFSENAAAFSTIIAELVNMLISVKYGINIVEIQGFFKNLKTVLISASTIVIVCYVISLFKISPIVRISTSIIFSAISYFFMLFILKNEVLISYLMKKRNCG